MIERLFLRPSVRRRMRASHLGIILERFALDLNERGYVITCLQSYVQIAEHFSRWLGHRRSSTAEVDEGLVERFLHRHLPHCRCPAPAPRDPGNCRAALGCFLRFLRERGLAPPLSRPALSAPERLVRDYDRYLDEVGGLAASTRQYRRRYARDFLSAVERGGPSGLENATPAQIRQYVERHAGRLKPASVAVLAISLRSFLRYLALKRRVDAKLPAAVPHPAPWPLGLPPAVLSRSELRAFLTCFNRKTAVGRRDYAMAVLMVDLGLRCQEVASLTLDDLDEDRKALLLRQTKQRRDRLLPLTPAVEKALLAYLGGGRPPSSSRALFVRHQVPRGSPLRVHHVRGAMRRAFDRAGIRSGKIHLLRHTLATRLHSAGVDLKQIADLMGHKSLDTTNRYARVDLRELRQAILPWPGGLR